MSLVWCKQTNVTVVQTCMNITDNFIAARTRHVYLLITRKRGKMYSNKTQYCSGLWRGKVILCAILLKVDVYLRYCDTNSLTHSLPHLFIPSYRYFLCIFILPSLSFSLGFLYFFPLNFFHTLLLSSISLYLLAYSHIYHPNTISLHYYFTLGPSLVTPKISSSSPPRYCPFLSPTLLLAFPSRCMPGCRVRPLGRVLAGR